MDILFNSVKKNIIIDDQPEIVSESNESIESEREPGSVEGLIDNEPIEPTEKELRANRIAKLKVIAFDEMHQYPLSLYSTLRQKDKKYFLELISKYDAEKSDEEIDKLFNEICIETIFDNKTIDYRNLPIYKNNYKN